MVTLFRTLMICLTLGLLPACSQEAQEQNKALTEQVQSLETDLSRLQRDLELKDKAISDLQDRLNQAQSAMSATLLGVKDPKDRIYARIMTNHGEIVSELFWQKTPLTVQNFVELAEGTKSTIDPETKKSVTKPFYNGLTFHRVIPNFMIQGGDPLGSGRGGPGYTFKDEFVDDLTFSQNGRLAMANRGPNTNGSQFFITTGTPTHLNGKHTIFGEVVKGMDVAEKISKVKTGPRNLPLEPVVIESVTIERRPAGQ